MNASVTYAQNREDIIIDAILDHQKHGFYLDIGANHPITDSVTKLFYERGWNGINVEPNARLHQALRLARPRDTNLQIGISNINGVQKFRDYVDGDGLSTFSDAVKESQAGAYRHFTKKYADREVPVFTLAEMLSEQAPPVIDFMKVDVEGLEHEVIEGNDWGRFRPRVICIEADHIVKDWHQILIDNGYEQIFDDGLNRYYADLSVEPPIAKFSYAEKVLMWPAAVPYKSFQKIHRLEREKKALEAINAAQVAPTRKADFGVDKPVRIRQLLKQLARKIDQAVQDNIRARQVLKIAYVQPKEFDLAYDESTLPEVLLAKIRLAYINGYFRPIMFRDHTGWKWFYKHYMHVRSVMIMLLKRLIQSRRRIQEAK